MSQKSLIQIQRFLVIVILFLVCVALILLILNKYQSTQKLAFNSPHQEQNLSTPQILDEKSDNPFKQIYYEKFISKDFNQSENLEQNLSPLPLANSFLQESEQNSTLIQIHQTWLENNISKELNQSFEKFQNNLAGLNAKDLNQTQQDLNSNQQEQNLSVLKTKQLNFKKTPPKLAIIIDDMSNEKQVKNLKALNLKITPSFFPPDKTHKNTAKLALKFDFYMVHLPLAALHYKKVEMDTLNPNDSEKRISKKIASLKENFKDLKYINNHTGSLFTSNEVAMRKLYKALSEKGFIFVDSKTIEHSKAEKIAKEFGKIYIKRDIFLDNEDNLAAIKKQIQKAVNLANKEGFAIAIGHPKKNTFKALEESKDLLKSVKLVYLSEVYGE
ncbi:divergent polysaccharide deacetylase family protein [Campylobacter cuniculorum]|uniref:divergent polysaccharide deacetylase family protein n=1 Tax=Campylobacter cuniculorum TaxID=374106 RepID=UPI0023F35020|nr:divergent polysaccharide deacetylase family protein [Campylobacter cuniculorum]